MSSMPPSQRIIDLINGYTRETFGIYAPDIIVHRVSLFYASNKIIPCNIFDNKYQSKINGINDIYTVVPNKYTQLYMTTNNELYVLTTNTKSDLGLGLNNSKTANILHKHKYFVNDNSVELVSHGQYNSHSFVYTTKNELYGFGSNENKQIGIKKKNGNAIQKIDYNFDSILINIECGYYHSLFLSEKGSVYGCGNNNYGQLTNSFKVVPRKRKNSSIDQLSVSNIKQIACTSFASAILDNNGMVITFGDNNNGELGVKIKKNGTNTPFESHNIPVSCDDISGGSFHVGCLSNTNVCYFFGWNNNGQCGTTKASNDNKKCLNIPTRIEFNDKIMELKCGRYHNIITTFDHKFFAFGMNKQNECLQETMKESIKIPTEISQEFIKSKTKSNKHIIDIIPGCEYTFILQML